MHNITATVPRNPGPPWHRRSRLWIHETQIIEMVAVGYSLAQIISALDLGCSRPWLCRWLQARRARLSHPLSPPAP